MPGRRAVSNALLALTIAELVGVPPKEAAQGIAKTNVANMRGELRRVGDLTVIVDCYNANPQSVVAALDVLEGQGTDARRVAVLGSMLELGASAQALHARVLAEARSRSIDLLVLTGDFAAAAAAEGLQSDETILVAPTWNDAWPELRSRLHGSEIVLLKASRGVALEGLLPLFQADFAPVEA